MSADIHSLLADLGKPTRRGIRKCPQCGTLNGTRGLSCKNRLCDMVFKEALERTRKIQLDPCKLITDEDCSRSILLSVRVRERGPDHVRGFIKLQHDELIVPSLVDTKSAVCYACPNTDTECMHVTAALQGGEFREAAPFTVKHSVLNAMAISAEWKHTIWLRARRDGPLVQRVSPTTMAVKCEVDARHPLGYLHTSFLCSGEGGPRFACACDYGQHLSGPPSPKKKLGCHHHHALNMHASNSPEATRCIHFYSCIAVFSGDSRLSAEFARFISDEQVVSSMQQVIAILGHDDNGDAIQVQVLDEDQLDLFQQQPVTCSSNAITSTTSSSSPSSMNAAVNSPNNKQDELEAAFQIEMESEDGSTHTISIGDDILCPTSSGPPAVTTTTTSSSLTNTTSSSPHTSHHKKPVDSSPSQSALEWLASVTERINQTMHYGFRGQPDALVFHVPQTFFSYLRERISAGSRKKRLPNSTVAFVRKDALPLGTFTKYTWLLTNVLHVKQVLDNPIVPLDITRRFARNKDSQFELLPSGQDSISNFSHKMMMMKQEIRPLEYKTFLKVGQMSADPRDVTPFTIEWIPDILPRMKIGELRIKFEYGHQKNGQLDPWPSTIPK